MVAPVRKAIWSDKGKGGLKAAYKFILQESYQNAVKVTADIVAFTRKLSLNPEQHPPDKYKLYNDGSYSAFEKHKYRTG